MIFGCSEGLQLTTYPYVLVSEAVSIGARSETWHIFVCSTTGTVRSNPALVMDVCVRFLAFEISSLDSGLARG